MNPHMNLQKKFNLVFVLALFALPLIGSTEKSDNEQTKEIVEEFDVNANSNVYFKHRRGTLTVKYIAGSKGKVEATVTVKGDDLEDIQDLLDAMTVDVNRENGQIEIKTANKIVSWSSNSGLWGKRHKIVLSNGKVIHSKVDDITVEAVLYLPKVNKLSLNNRYDNIIIEGYQADKLGIDIHSATIRAGSLLSDTYIKVKYGKLDIENVQDLNLDSHDSKGKVGDIGQLLLKDKYSDFEFGNLKKLEADLHDANIEFKSINGDANIKDKYSVISLLDMQDGIWDLHDSKISVTSAGKVRAKSKYTNFDLGILSGLTIDSHDDDIKIDEIDELLVPHSKYTKYEIGLLNNGLYSESSHDDNFDINRSSGAFAGLKIDGKYTKIDLPMPAGIGYAINADMKYGELIYPEEGLKEMRYVKDGSELEVKGVAADGSKNVEVIIKCHDCKIDLGN